ncbi:hypothetical protein DICVIV_03131 [Dictyocaulus viviparus]|uniref:Uncharacterized protein n=1 Tax=Dictyocaulus viviparus TaxID=29172 RepID=A0A0D8Y7Z8_DICVI|nr:hypothetical protein DICVIV_03131 [Dictyocaulus viviparus]
MKDKTLPERSHRIEQVYHNNGHYPAKQPVRPIKHNVGGSFFLAVTLEPYRFEMSRNMLTSKHDDAKKLHKPYAKKTKLGNRIVRESSTRISTTTTATNRF